MATTHGKLNMTSEIGEKLKDFRNQYKVKAKDLAEHLGKSGAYISKLEKGEIRTIEKQEFVKITNFITKTENGYETFCETVAALVDSEFIERSALLLNFDWVDRKIPIPDELLKYINDKIEKNNIDIVKLIEYINSNEDLDENFFVEQNLDKADLEFNTFMPYYEADSNTVSRNFILVHLEYEEISKILCGKIKKTSYLCIYSILYHIFKTIERKTCVFLDDGIKNNIKKKTENKLISYKFYTLSNKRSLLNKAKEAIEPQDVLSSFDCKNRDLMSSIVGTLSALSDYDVDYMNKKMEMISRNLRSKDPSFAVAYMALDIEKLAIKPIKIKREFLNGVSELVEKCLNMEDDEFEKY